MPTRVIVLCWAADHALRIIIADTKFEFGIDRHGNLLADGMLTGLVAVLACRHRAGVVRQASTVCPPFLSAAG